MPNQALNKPGFWWSFSACVLAIIAAVVSLSDGMSTWLAVMWFCLAAFHLGLAFSYPFPWRVLRMVINIIKGEP